MIKIPSLIFHAFYSKDFEVLTADVYIITQKLVKVERISSRLIGSGFGGFGVSLINNSN